MARDNDVFKVLVTNSDLALLAKNKEVSELAPNQIGIFDRKTNLSVDGTTACEEFYIALGKDRDGDTVLDDIEVSAGQYIQANNIENIVFSESSLGANQKIKVSGYKPMCETEYGIRINFQNEDIFNIQGNNQFSKSYIIKTRCCGGGCSELPIDCNEITAAFLKEIKNETLFTVVAKSLSALTAATHGTSDDYSIGDPIPVEDVEALVTFNEAQEDEANKICTYLEFETTPMQVSNYCGIPMNYKSLLGTKLEISLIEGMSCGGSVTQTQELAFPKGLGNNVRDLEYKSGGWSGNPGPYRTSSVFGLSNEINYVAEVSSKYTYIIIEYKFQAESGWKEYKNDLCTYICVKETTTHADEIYDALVALKNLA